MMDQVQGIIIEYLAGRITARDLGTGLPDGWELDQKGDAAARDLTLRAVGYLAEYERGDRDDSGLRGVLLSQLLPTSPQAVLSGGRTEIREIAEPVVSTRLGSRPLLEVFA